MWCYLDVAVIVNQLVGDIMTFPARCFTDVSIWLPVPVCRVGVGGGGGGVGESCDGDNAGGLTCPIQQKVHAHNHSHE